MSSRQKRVIVPLDDTAREGLAWLSAATGLGEDALAKRLLQAILNVIAGAMENGEPLAEPIAPLSPLEQVLEPEAVRRKLFGPPEVLPHEARRAGDRG